MEEIKKHVHLKFIMLILVVLFGGLSAFWSWKNDLDFRIVDPCELNQAFEQGNWVFALSYVNSSDKNYVEVYSPDSMDEEGRIGKVYAQIKLPVDKNRTSLNIKFDEYTTNVQIRLVKIEGECRLTELSYRNTERYNDAIIIYVLLVICLVAAITVLHNSSKKKETFWITICLFSVILISMSPYMNSFLTKGHDLDFHLMRIEGIYQGLMLGEFPIRVNTVQANGYGYITPIMYPQLLLYIPALFRLLGLSLLNSYKLLVWMGTIITVYVSYYSFKRVLNNSWAGMIASTFFSLGLYRLTNVYCRAAVGEFLAMAFLPLVFYGMYEILVGDYRKWIWGAIGLTLTFQQHLITMEIVLVFIFITCVFFIRCFIKKPQRIWALMKAAFITVLLNIGTLLPIMDFMRENLTIVRAKRYLPDMVVYLSEVFATFVEMKGKQMLRGTTSGEMPLSIGGVLLFVASLFLIYSYHKKLELECDRNLYLLKKLGEYCIIVGTLAIIMSMWFFPWTMLSKIPLVERFASSLQFFSRLLMVPATLFSLVGGVLVAIMLKKYPERKNIIIGSAFLIAVISCLYPLESVIQNPSYESKAEVAGVSYTDELYLYDGDKKDPLENMGKRIWVSDDAEIVCKNLTRQGTEVECNLELYEISNNTYIELPLYYYPQYKVELNGKELKCDKGTYGVIRAYLNQENKSGNLKLYYDVPVIWKAAELLSAITLTGVLIYIFRIKRRRVDK